MTITAVSRPAVRIPAHGTQTVALAAGATLLSLAGSWIPSYWGDEAATVMSAERPLSTLWPMLGTVDAVHGVYYVFMHFWIALFGASEFSTRLPSAIAVGIATAGVVVLARRLFDARLALLAGLVFSVLPRVSFMGVEARSYAIGTAIAVWCTWMLARALRERTARWWIAYAALLAIGLYLFLFLGLLMAVHAAWIAVTRVNWSDRWRWAVAVIVAVLSAAPIISLDIAQRHQVAFIATRHTVTVTGIAFDQWFSGPWVGVVAWILIAVGIVAARRTPAMRLLAAWIVLPTALLVAMNTWIAPSYSLRYLSFCTPAIAIAVALGIRSVGARWRQLVAALLLAAVIVPVYVGQRTAYAKDGGSDLRQLADYVGSVAAPGDAVAFDDTVRPSRKPRLALRLYPRQFAGLDDIELSTPYQQTSGLWDVVVPLADRTAQLADVHTVWLVDEVGSKDTSAETLASLGFTAATAHRVHRETVTEFTRG